MFELVEINDIYMNYGEFSSYEEALKAKQIIEPLYEVSLKIATTEELDEEGFYDSVLFTGELS